MPKITVIGGPSYPDDTPDLAATGGNREPDVAAAGSPPTPEPEQPAKPAKRTTASKRTGNGR